MVQHDGFFRFLALSAAVHAVAALGVALRPAPAVVAEPVYYVDLTPSALYGAAAMPAAPKVVQHSPAATVPAATPAATPAAAPVRAVTGRAQQAPPQESGSYGEQEHRQRLEKLAEAAEARRFAERVASMAGPSASRGGDVGYRNYLRSRLTDAFAQTIRGDSRSSQALVAITIDGRGRLESASIVRPSDSAAFDQSALAAVALAARTLVAPPGGGRFSTEILFSPLGARP